MHEGWKNIAKMTLRFWQQVQVDKLKSVFGSDAVCYECFMATWQCQAGEVVGGI
jgi:hypothetical protein